MTTIILVFGGYLTTRKHAYTHKWKFQEQLININWLGYSVLINTLHVRIYVCMYACKYVRLYVCMNVCKCVGMYMYVCMYICMCVFMYMHVCTCMYVYMYVRMYVCMYVCMDVCAVMHVQ